MDLRQLNALVAIAEHGSFSAAADALATVQSNVSTHVKKLESELGSELVDRQSGELTEAGVLAVDRARRVLAEIDALSSDVTALSHEVTGTVRLGSIGTAARWLIPQLLQMVPTRHPLMHLVFCESTTLGIDRQLAVGYVDLGVLALPASGSEVRSVALFEEDFGLAVPADHPFAERAEVTLAEISNLPLLLPLPGSNYRDELDSLAARAGVKLRPRAEMDSLRLVQALTLRGLRLRDPPLERRTRRGLGARPGGRDRAAHHRGRPTPPLPTRRPGARRARDPRGDRHRSRSHSARRAAGTRR